MNQSLLVVDDFYQDPLDVRQYSLSSEFNVRGNYPGLRTRPFLNDSIRATIQRLVRAPISYWPEDEYNGAFQYATARERTWIHADQTTNYAGVVYLTPAPPPRSGTSFYQHIETGARLFSDNPAVRARCDHDAQDYTKWIVLDSVANVFNRLILFDSRQYHASDLYFGDSAYNARLFQTFFFNVGI
jgi:hypothetical protein